MNIVKPWKPKTNHQKKPRIRSILFSLQEIKASTSKHEIQVHKNIIERNLWYPEFDSTPTKYSVRIRSIEAEQILTKKDDVRFEHIYPKKWIISELQKLDPLTETTVTEFLNQYLIVALITKEEDTRLNKQDSALIGFARYEAAGIPIASVLYEGGCLT